MPLVLNGTTGVQDNSGAFVAGTAVASTSGTSIDFTSIPSWVKRVTICYAGISLSGTASYLVQIGTSGGVQTSGYLGASAYAGASVSGVNYTTGFGINQGNPAEIRSGIMTLVLLNSATGLWVASYADGWSSQAYGGFGGGQKTLSGTLDRIRFTTNNGTDTFDAGSINITYE
jgi:hypothetical protein